MTKPQPQQREKHRVTTRPRRRRRELSREELVEVVEVFRILARWKRERDGR